MKHYLESNKFYVMNEDAKLVYKVAEFETYGDAEFITVELELVAGWDYVNPDENDVQGWVGADRFVEDIQFEYVNQYFLVEGMKEALEANDYTILGNPEKDGNGFSIIGNREKFTPDLKAIIDKHNEF